MRNEELPIIVVLISAVVFSVTVKVIGFFVHFSDDVRYITSEMKQAFDESGYLYWRKELRCRYLRLIPFVNEKNVIRVYEKIYHKSENSENINRSDGIYHVLAPSFIAVCLCIVCLCGASWAWFGAAQTSNVTNIQTATYTVGVTAETDESFIDVAQNNGTYTVELKNAETYKIKVTANGTANNGYCTVNLGGEIYHTPQIKKDADFTFEVEVYKNGKLTLTPQWGTCATSDDVIASGKPLVFGTKSEKSEPETATADKSQKAPKNSSENVAEKPTEKAETTVSEPTQSLKPTDPPPHEFAVLEPIPETETDKLTENETKTKTNHGTTDKTSE